MGDVERARERQDEERRRKRDLLCVEAFGLLRRLVHLQANGGLEYDAYGQSYCLFCYVAPTDEHEDDCLYAAAVRLLRELEGE